MHNDNIVDETSKKPEIILFYNSTKGGVDALDQKCSNYLTNQRTRRWSITIFYMLLNMSAINSRVIYQCTPYGKQIGRNEYIKQLGISSCESHIKHRIYNPISLKLIQNVLLYDVMKFINWKEKDVQYVYRTRTKKQTLIARYAKLPYVWNVQKNLSKLFVRFFHIYVIWIYNIL